MSLIRWVDGPDPGNNESMMTFYYSPGANSLAPHIILEEMGIAFRPCRVTIAKGETQTPEFLAINPKGRVPALVVGKDVLTETTALLAYLASLDLGAGFLPQAGSVAYARCFEWLGFLSSSAQVVYWQYWRPERFLPNDFPLRAEFAAYGLEAIAAHNLEIEVRIGSAWLLGSQYSIADAYLLPFYRWGLRAGLPMSEACPQWTRWKNRMLRRAAVRRVIARESVEGEWDQRQVT